MSIPPASPPPEPPDPPDPWPLSRNLLHVVTLSRSHIFTGRCNPCSHCPGTATLITGFVLCSGGLFSVDMRRHPTPKTLSLSHPSPDLLHTAIHPRFLQVCSHSSTSVFPSMDFIQIFVEWVALGLWISDLLLLSATVPASLSPTVVSCGDALIALVQPFTAVCSFLSVFSLTVFASVSFSMWHIGKISVSRPIPVILVLDFRSPLLSVKESYLLPITLVLSVIISGINVLKAVLFRTETKRHFVFKSASAVVDGLGFSSLVAWIPPSSGHDQDGKCCYCLVVVSVEHGSSRLSSYLCLSCCSFCFSLCLNALVCWLFVASCIP